MAVLVDKIAREPLTKEICGYKYTFRPVEVNDMIAFKAKVRADRIRDVVAGLPQDTLPEWGARIVGLLQGANFSEEITYRELLQPDALQWLADRLAVIPRGDSTPVPSKLTSASAGGAMVDAALKQLEAGGWIEADPTQAVAEGSAT